jgi:glycine/D-amino acid oxidase-like deaminating enzyme
MTDQTAGVVICGAGIIGAAVAYELAAVRGVRDVVLVEQGEPLSLTSDKSTEAYRNWWPGPDDAMVRLMDRSADRLEAIARATGNAILLNRRGYLYATADEARLPAFRAEAEAISALGAGELRVHAGGAGDYTPSPAHGWEGVPGGADLILDRGLIRAHFPYLAESTAAVLHARRAGWLSGWQLGMWLLEQARAHGAALLRGRVAGVEQRGGRVSAVRVAQAGGGEARVATGAFVSAAGPLQAEVGRMLGLELPLFNELHLKAAIDDRLGVIPRDAPMLIWADPVRLPWDDDERAALAGDRELRWLIGELPAGAHLRPEGGPGASTLLLLWDYHTGAVEPRYPIALDEQLPEVALRGLATMAPGLGAYLASVPRAAIDGGYYTRTRENRPLIGPLAVEGAYIAGGFSGFGLMAACAAGELLGAHLTGGPLPSYARAFLPSRYDDPAYLAALDAWGGDGQL